LLLTVALLRTAGESVPDSCLGRLRQMTQALVWLSRPDGSLRLFNDSANGIAPPADDLFASARAVLGAEPERRSGAFSLPGTGFRGLVSEDQKTRLVVDAGEPAPRYQPGHAHCGLLSFELDWSGRSVIVDSGVHGYDGDPYREYVRSTRAHNTVSVGGSEQSEVWATFRVARRARLVSATSGTDEDGFHFSGSYRPYHDRRCLHTREIDLAGGTLAVSDRVTGSAGKRVVSYLHFHPGFAVELEGHVGQASCADLSVQVELRGFDRIQVVRGSTDPVQGWFCPEFGKAMPASVIEMTIDSNDQREFGYVLRMGSA
ncbi:MAG: heparinase II/III-family protein, partial [Gemmatimonadota bacterium]